MPQANNFGDDSKKRPSKQSTDSKAVKKSYEQSLVYEKSFLKKKEQLQKDSTNKVLQDQTQKEIARIKQQYAREIAEANKATKDKDELNKTLNELYAKRDKELYEQERILIKQKKQIEFEAHQTAVKCCNERFKTMNVHQRNQTALQLKDASKLHAEEMKLEAEARQIELDAALEVAKTENERLDIERQKQKITEQVAQAEAEAASYEKQAAEYAEIVKKVNFERLSAVEKVAAREKEIQEKKSERDEALNKIDSNIAAYKLDIKEAEESGDTEAVNRLTEELKTLEKTFIETRESYDESIGKMEDSLQGLGDRKTGAGGGLKYEATREKVAAINNRSARDMASDMAMKRMVEKAEADKQAEADKAYRSSEYGKAEAREQSLEKAVKNLEQSLRNALTESLAQIDRNINSFYEYQAQIEARLQGSEESYKDSLKTISKNVGLSGYVSQKAVVENIKKLVDQGIAYDLDLRAFLATVSDRVATTFDVFDSNLLRLIRLQQSDTTAARLGMEASLTRLFNEFFSDSSYLTDAFDGVSQSIIEANSQLTKDMSIEFEYMVQKWLGSLYSVGMDQATVNTIAQGLNYLGTGNVEALNSNDSLQSLLAMSASRAGISYADILTGGLDADTTNDLMKSMVEYLKTIAENSDNNQVTKSAYSNVFGFNISDLTAVSSLSEQDISNIHNQSLNYEGAMKELDYQTSQIASRTHISQVMQTVFDNALAGASTEIGNSAAAYVTWMVLNTIEGLTGGIDIPTVTVMGNSVALNSTVTRLGKTGIAGLGLMGSLLSSLFNGSLFGTMDVNKWGYDEFTSRGSSTKGISKGTASGFSESSEFNFVGSASSKDVKSTTLTDGASSAEEDAKITNASVEGEADIYEKIYGALAEGEITVLTEVQQVLKETQGITHLLREERTFKTEMDSITQLGESLTYLLREERRFKAETNGISDLKNLLDPARVFYTSLVGILPTDSSSFSINNNTKVTTYNGKTTKASSISNIESYADDIDSTLTSLHATTTTSNSSSNTSATNSNSLLTSSQYNSNSQLTSSSQLQASSNLTSNLYAEMIGALSASNAASSKTSTQIVTPSGIKVTLEDLSPDVQNFILSALRSMVASALSEDLMSEDGTVSESFMSKLTSLLTNMDVHINNNFFDEANQKTAFR